MTCEYRQWTVNTKGWVDLKLTDHYLEQLNKMALQGWKVAQMMPIHSGVSGTTAVVFLLKRKIETG